MTTILHITTVHPRRDTRIFYRECMSLKNAGFKTWLLVADGLGDEEENGLMIVDIGKTKSRLSGFRKQNRLVVQKAMEINPAVIHLHDPELIVVGRRLKKKLKVPVIFDIHENIPLQILNKDYLPGIIKPLTSKLYAFFERLTISPFHLILAETSYLKYYKEKGKTVTTVLNMPKLDDFKAFVNADRSGNGIFYIGAITADRGVFTILEALKELRKREINYHMHFIGRLAGFTKEELPLESIEENVTFYGRLDSKKGFELAENCVVGLSILKPIKNYVESYSTKIFEYMAIGLPVITSNFPLYTAVVEKYESGFCVDPFNAIELADKIEVLLNNPTEVTRMGNNGIRTVAQLFNWSTERKKLIELYNSLIHIDQ